MKSEDYHGHPLFLLCVATLGEETEHPQGCGISGANLHFFLSTNSIVEFVVNDFIPSEPLGARVGIK